MRSAEQRLPAFIFPSSPEKGRSLFLGELALARSVAHSRRAVIGHRGSLLPRRFGTSVSGVSGRISRLASGARGLLASRRWAPGSVGRPARTIARRAPPTLEWGEKSRRGALSAARSGGAKLAGGGGLGAQAVAGAAVSGAV